MRFWEAFVNNIEIQVKEVLYNVFEKTGRRHLLNANIDEIPGFDSIIFIYLIVELENKFDITISDENITVKKFKDLNSIISIILEELKNKN